MTRTKITIEFSRPLLVDRVPRKGSHELIEASPEECAALARRFSIHALKRLSARLFMVPWRGGGMKVTGTVEAEVEQVSIISLEVFATKNKFEIERYFLPSGKIDEKIEDDADPIINGEIDIGELAAETLGLELDAYPRKPDETFEDQMKN